MDNEDYTPLFFEETENNEEYEEEDQEDYSFFDASLKTLKEIKEYISENNLSLAENLTMEDIEEIALYFCK